MQRRLVLPFAFPDQLGQRRHSFRPAKGGDIPGEGDGLFSTGFDLLGDQPRRGVSDLVE